MTLKEYIALSNLSYRDLSLLWKVSHSTIWYWATGRTTPTPKHRKLIEKKTGGDVTTWL